MLDLIKSMTEKLPKNRLELTKIIDELKQPFLPENVGKVGENISCSIKRILGRGDQSSVILGFFNKTQVAVKRISNMDTLCKEDKEKFCRERENFKTLVHPNILKFFGLAVDEFFM